MCGPQPRFLPLSLLLLRTLWHFNSKYSEQSDWKYGWRLDFGYLGDMERGEDEGGFERSGLKGIGESAQGGAAGRTFLYMVQLHYFVLGFSAMFLIVHLWYHQLKR